MYANDSKRVLDKDVRGKQRDLRDTPPGLHILDDSLSSECVWTLRRGSKEQNIEKEWERCFCDESAQDSDVRLALPLVAFDEVSCHVEATPELRDEWKETSSQQPARTRGQQPKNS